MKVDAARVLDRLPLRMATANVVAVEIDDDTADGAFPASLRNWLVHLRLLEGVPFANLVADTELLPEESIRWFYVDRDWTDALVQGALSVGTVNSDDRTQLTAAYPAIRAELDREERNVRRGPTENRLSGDASPISGFLLRSRAVAGWPGLHVRAYDDEPIEDDDDPVGENDPHRIRLLRLERLAPAVLLCLFDGVPRVVHIEEPRQGIQFGFEATTSPSGNVRATLPVRDVEDFSDTGAVVDVPFRAGSTGVVDIQALERTLKDRHPESGIGASLDSAEYALQLVRFPYRQVWGDPSRPDVSVYFKPVVMYQALVAGGFTIGGGT
jgi:hypothetical protein